MFASKLYNVSYNSSKILTQQLRKLQVSIVGAANEIGSNLALLLKQNPNIDKLKLHDNDHRVLGIGIELDHLPGGAAVSAYAGDQQLESALQAADILVLVSAIPRQPGITREQMFSVNAPFVHRFCEAIVQAELNDPFIAISTNPLNMVIPLASMLLHKKHYYNPYKVFGITHIDSSRSRAYAGNALQVNPQNLSVPVIGGHSEQTIIPLFSNIFPSHCYIDQCQADMLTRLIRKAGTEVINQKHGAGSAVCTMAWSINEFLQGLTDAVSGKEKTLHCFTANPHFGTRFFAGPTAINEKGISTTDCYNNMNNYESELLHLAIPFINKDVAQAEAYADSIAF